MHFYASLCMVRQLFISCLCLCVASQLSRRVSCTAVNYFLLHFITFFLSISSNNRNQTKPMCATAIQQQARCAVSPKLSTSHHYNYNHHRHYTCYNAIIEQLLIQNCFSSCSCGLRLVPNLKDCCHVSGNKMNIAKH